MYEKEEMKKQIATPTARAAGLFIQRLRPDTRMHINQIPANEYKVRLSVIIFEYRACDSEEPKTDPSLLPSLYKEKRHRLYRTKCSMHGTSQA